MELSCILLMVHIALTQSVDGLILLNPDTDVGKLIDTVEFNGLDIFNKLVDVRKASLNAYRHHQQEEPFNEEVGEGFTGYNEDTPEVENDLDPSNADGTEVPMKVMEPADYYDVKDFIYDENSHDFVNSQIDGIRRRKRSTVARVDANVEVLVVVDNVIYRRYLEQTRNQREALAMLRQYYGMLFAMVDQRFKTIDDPEMSISVKISGILVSETRQEAGWAEYLVTWSRRGDEGRLNANKALKKFVKWLQTQKNLPRYDHAMAFTGYQLVNKASIDLGGMAYVSSICNERDGTSASIAGDPGDFQVVKVATHELGHSLGASHDGDSGNRDCPSDRNYIMAPQTSNEHDKLRNAFYFSECSIRQMKKVLRSEQAECVRDNPVVYYHYNLQRQPPGQRYSADQQCKLIFGKKSEFCETEKMKSVMCGQLWCKDPDNGRTCRTHSYLTALPGTPCGNEKVCHLGACLKNPYGTSRPQVTSRIRSSFNQVPRRPTQAASSQNSDRQSQIIERQRLIRERLRQIRERQLQASERQRASVGRPTIQSQKPTSRMRTRLNSSRRSGRRRQHGNGRRQGGRRRGRGRGRTSRQRSKSKAVCTADQNVEYCYGLIKVNPRVCRRKAVRKYCCRTCAFKRKRRA